ncbi:HpcH/HpaI aldolase/citrate lyase family protein [Paenibacillus sp. GCM10027626]|uniref:HpcH/HpaI aldolase family protein n=1 Tax=Paenibacillus sp. GCM10027626 TaxID=3273411 RepID=UPI003624AEB7
MAINPLRHKLKQGEQTFGMWVTMESPSISEIAITLGLDWVCIDMEHGHLDYKEVMEHVRTVRNSDTSILVRVPEISNSAIKRVLDMGAHGVLLPLVRNAEELQTGFNYARYPDTGIRGIGGERSVKWGLGLQEYLEYANEETMVVPLIETKDAAEQIDSILDVPGLEAIFFGPADLSASYGYLGQWEGPGVAQIILDIKAKADQRGIASGVMSTGVEDSIQRIQQKFGMVGFGSDAGLLIRSTVDNMEKAGLKRPIHLWF